MTTQCSCTLCMHLQRLHQWTLKFEEASERAIQRESIRCAPCPQMCLRVRTESRQALRSCAVGSYAPGNGLAMAQRAPDPPRKVTMERGRPATPPVPAIHEGPTETRQRPEPSSSSRGPLTALSTKSNSESPIDIRKNGRCILILRASHSSSLGRASLTCAFPAHRARRHIQTRCVFVVLGDPAAGAGAASMRSRARMHAPLERRAGAIPPVTPAYILSPRAMPTTETRARWSLLSP